ncbi:MAG: hypothetical protein NC907_04650, partial [Candidatus Omnitrophica bacterium]|nr:hypothetical protein [Candidatus Omnitrophota bacterium]
MNKTLWQYYVDKATEITNSALENIRNINKWKSFREQIKNEFFISVGLHPFPEKCDLSIRIVGELKGSGFTTKKIVYRVFPDAGA